MKTQFTLWQKVANTPPIALLILFVWLLAPSNAWGDVTAEWGESFGGTSFPSETSSLVNNVTLSTAMPTHNNAWLGGTANTDHYNIGTGSSIDIKASDGYKIKQLKTSVRYSTDVRLTIHFSASSPYDGNILKSVDITGHGSDDANLYDVEVPNGAKSAHIVSTGTLGYGAYFYRLQVTVTEADPCSASVTASFAKAASETGEVPANKDICTDYSSSFTIPGKNTLVYDTKHAFVGWEKDGVTYAEGDTYTITSADITAGSIGFTAVWSEVNVTDLTITDPVNNTIPLSWKIPGICDLSRATSAEGKSDQYNGTNTTTEGNYYNPVNGEVTAAGNSGSYGQYGVAFPIPNTTNVQTITVDWKGAADFSSKGVNLWAGILASDKKTYWDCGEFHQPTNWDKQTFTINTKYWTDCPGNNYNNPAGTTVQYIGVFANAGVSGASNLSFSVRDVRYHVAGRADIDHIVLVRKAGSVPADKEDGDVLLSNSTKSHFIDTDVKTPGTTYYYAVFAVYSDASVSSPVYVSHTMETVDTYNVTYAKGGDDVTGEVPVDEAEYAATNSVTVAGKNTLARPGHHFAGWNDGTTTYAAGASYTMPAHDVTFTAVWTPFTVPTVTNLAVGEAVDTEVPLSWKIPGICDLSSAVNATVTPSSQYGTGYQYVEQQSYNEADNYITVSGRSVQWSQYGAGFDIPATTDVEWISYEFKGNHNDISIWGGACDGENAYWKYNTLKSLNDGENWMQSGVEIPNIIYWDGTMDGAITSKTISQIAVYANAGGGTYDDVSFSVRNVRYHIAGQEDIDHVIVVRKDGSAPANATDGTVYNVGTKSHFLDDDNTKEFGHTYYYSVYAVHADGTVSEATTTSHTIVATPTCNITFNVGDGAIGDAPDAVEGKPENSVVTMPAIGSVYKPFYAFTGWKKNNASDLLSAGSTYTVTAEDVTAETISFTAQWEEDNTTIRIPNTKTFGVSNRPANINTISDVDFNNDGNGDAALDIQSTAAEWSVFIQPGYYEVSMLSAVWRYGMKYTLSLIDPLTDTPVKTFFTKNISRSQNQTQYLNDTVGTFDLTDLIKGKRYILKMEDTWPDCYLRLHHIQFTPAAPIEISASTPTVFDASKTLTSGLETATDVDFDGDATTQDESINLYNKKMDWVVKINPGYYNISLLYGAPEYSTRVSVALIDPEGVEPTRWFCPDQNDRNGHYYYTSGSQGVAYHSVGEARYNLYDITPDKSYILRVQDEYGKSNSLRVKDLTFTPIAPLNIPEVTRLNAANAVVSPGTENVTIDGEGTVECLDIAGLKEAAWYAYIAPGIYDIKLTYVAATGGTKVRFGIIDIASGDTVFVKQENKYSASNTTYTISALSQNFTTIGGGVYKIIVKDNYTSNGVPSNGSVPKVAHLDIERTLLTHTRSGLRIGDYGTICLPYAVAAADRTGAELFEIESWAENGTSMTMTQLNENENMIAGRPYIFQATANTATFSYYVDGEEAEAGTHNGLIGSYVETEIPQNADNYIIYNNKLYMVNSANVWVGANRAYIHKGSEYSPAPANRRRVTMGLYGTQTTTDINQISTEQITNKVIRNGYLFILRGDKIYNAQGQLVQ